MTHHRDQSNCGSALVAAAVSAGILAIVVAALLTYLTDEANLNYRSHRWTQTLHLAEAGIDLAFAEFNYQYFQGGNGFQSDRGWSGSGGVYTKTVTGLTDTDGASVGDITLTVSGVGGTSPQITAVGTCAGAPRGPSVSRAVRVTLASSSMYPVALMSKNQINLNGNNIYTDSFDSSDPNKSSSGLYDSNKRQANGDIASNDVLINTVNIGNADVYGNVFTGPGGTVAMGANGSVGPTFVDDDRADTVAEGEAAGSIRHDFSVDVPEVTLPTGATSWPNPSAGSTINNTATITAGDYKVGSIDLAGTKTLTIQGPGTVRLYVTGNTSVAGNAAVSITGGATLIVYAAGSMAVGGNGISNASGKSENNQFYGLPSSTSWSISGNGQWVGTIYAPQADVTMNGGGSAGDMSGAVVAKSITLNGHVKFHYDEYLRDSPTFGSSYLVASWEELKSVNGSWVAASF
jgi:hypothetical protein